jgi:pilin isopeptide linkage protein
VANTFDEHFFVLESRSVLARTQSLGKRGKSMNPKNKRIHKWLSFLLSFVLAFSMCVPAYAAPIVAEDGTGICEHHPEHDASCGYVPASEGSPCTHVHDESCGYVEASAGSPCTHTHDASCGYQEGTPCNMECTDLDGDGIIDHAKECAYTEPSPCHHVHDSACGYQAPTEGHPCNHVHDENCGYQEATEGSPCKYAVEGCPECLAAADALSDRGINPLAEELPQDPSYIVVQKTISGLKDEQVETLKGTLTITVQGTDDTYTLTYGKNDGNILWRENGNTWAWRINGADVGNYTVSESGAKVEGTTLTATGTGNVSIETADIDISVQKETTCSHTDWPVYEGKFFAGALTNRGVVVITTRSPSASQRQAIENALLGGNWKAPVYYYSLNNLSGADSYELTVQGKTLTYYPNQTAEGESTPGMIDFADTSEWTHVAAVSYSTEAAQLADIPITNRYTQPVVLDGELNLNVLKNLTGRDWQDSDRFSFTISAEGNAPMPESNTITINGSDVQKTAHFGDITYTTPGTYVYTIRENQTNIPGISRDTTVYQVTVTVTADENGMLQTAVSYLALKDGVEQPFDYETDHAMTFTNVYEVDEATAKLNGHKHLSGKTLSANQFRFYVESVTVDQGTPDEVTYTDFAQAKDAGVPLPTAGLGENNAITNGRTGTVSEYEVYFGDLTFTQTHTGHTYTYTIKEVLDNQTGYTYDTASKAVTYAVSLATDENLTQHVEVQVTPDASTPDTAQHGYFVFENRYEPLPCTAQPSAIKTLTGRDMEPGETFGFTLTANSQNPAGASLPQNTTATVSGAADGIETSFSFDAITFTKPGTYQFFIRETSWNGDSLPANGTNGMTFDTTRLSVTYQIRDNNGQLEVASISYGSSGDHLENVYQTISVDVSKIWEDQNDQDGIRPNDITVKLLADGADTGKTLTLSEGNSWSGSFTDLDEYKGGQKIVYTIEEVSVSDYQSAITGDASTGFVITNTHTPETISISGSKTWDDANDQDGKRPDSITIRLYADGQGLADKAVTEDDGWAWTFEDLPKYKDGTEIVYTITEDTVPGYTAQVDGFDVTNSYTPGKTGVSVTKNWDDHQNEDGIRPNDITVKLLADGADTGKTLTLSEDNRWSGSFTDLDEYKDGQKIVYTIEEDAVNGYQSVITGDASTGFVITNTHTPETISISGSKTWDDANDQDGKRPDSITIRLYADGQELEDKALTVTEDDGWAWTFEGLPKYENGTEIVYTITEDAVAEYTSEVNGFDVTNRYTPSKTGVSVTKNWDDDDDRDDLRPKDITVKLLADGEDTGKTLILSEDNRWSGSFTDLDEYKDEHKIAYTIEEVAVDDYQTVITGDAVKGFVITNSHTPKAISKTPRTGDDSNLGLWIGFLFVSGIGLFAVTAAGKKKKQNRA